MKEENNFIKRQKFSDSIYQKILEEIFCRRLKAGTKLKERELAEKLGVSRTPVREAFHKLAKDGVIEMVPFRGALVKKWNDKDLKEVYEIRASLECLAVRLALPNIPGKKLKKIRARLRKVKREKDFMKTDLSLHRLVMNHCGNKKLFSILENLHNLVHTFRVLDAQFPERNRQSQKEHLQIIDALLKKDAQGSINLMAKHIENTENNILNDFFKNKEE